MLVGCPATIINFQINILKTDRNRVNTWVLMNNHFHLLVETSEANLSMEMKPSALDWLKN
jgi:REP element-mobilizing transposase RayT